MTLQTLLVQLVSCVDMRNDFLKRKLMYGAYFSLGWWPHQLCRWPIYDASQVYCGHGLLDWYTIRLFRVEWYMAINSSCGRQGQFRWRQGGNTTGSCSTNHHWSEQCSDALWRHSSRYKLNLRHPRYLSLGCNHAEEKPGRNCNNISWSAKWMDCHRYW